MTDQRIDRLVFWNRVWFCLLVVLGLSYWLSNWVRSVQDSLKELQPVWVDGGLRLTCASDGPFVITHLVDRKQNATATLPQPLAYIDSKGVLIPTEEYEKLEWRSFLGQKVDAPAVGSEVTALYYRALEARPREK